MRYHSLTIGGALLLAIFSCTLKTNKPATEQVQAYLLAYSDSLRTSLDVLMADVNGRRFEKIRGQFEKARRHYKYLEPFTELYFPGFSDAINGPAIDESEVYEGKLVTPTGFQVVEEYLYPQLDTSRWEELRMETTTLATMTNRLDQLIASNLLTDTHVFQAIRLQVFRIATLGIGGFDSPVALRSLPESIAALEGIRMAIMCYGDKHQRSGLENSITLAQVHLAGQGFDSFDRASFIRNDLDIISKDIYDFQRALGIPNNQFLGAINPERVKLFDADLLRTDHFANPVNREFNSRHVELGRMLFFDPVLSGNGQRACASCHQPSKAFTDGRRKSLAFAGKGEIQRNAPTIINSFLQRVQFFDSRIMFLEDQAADVIANPSELHGKMAESVATITKSDEYRQLFTQAFGDGETVTERNVQKALAAYIRSLTSLNSPFDRYMRGEDVALSAEVLSGFTIFMSKAKCSICHFPPLFNGTIPPLYTKSESEVLGIPSTSDSTKGVVDADPGKAHVFSGPANEHAFKTPTVRNAAITGPYMHNGVYSTLEEVIDFYNRGGGSGLGIELENQTLPTDKLMLTSKEKKALIAFINSLTDTTGLTSSPKRLPSFNDPRLDGRKVGGEY